LQYHHCFDGVELLRKQQIIYGRLTSEWLLKAASLITSSPGCTKIYLKKVPTYFFRYTLFFKQVLRLSKKSFGAAKISVYGAAVTAHL